MKDIKLLNFFKGECSPEEKTELFDWIDQSPENMEQYAALRKLWDLSVLTNKYESSGNILAYSKLRKRMFRQKTRSVWHRIATNLGRVAAVAVVAIISYHFIVTYVENRIPIKINTVEVPVGSRAKLSLPDGTTVWLNSKSKLTYPEKFDKKSRSVTLSGEGYFDVKTIDSQPFIVETESETVKVLGTQFNICAYHESSRSETTLFTGSVLMKFNDAAGKQLKLKPGQCITYDKLSGETTVRDDDYSHNVSMWMSGYYAFENVKLSLILEKLSNYFGKKIVIKNQKMGDYECTGKFKDNDTLEHILSVVEVSKPFKYKITENEVVIY